MRRNIAALTLVAAGIFATRVGAQDVIAVEGVVNAPVATVWKAWTTAAGLKAWLAPHADFDLRVGGLMRSNYDQKGTLSDSGAIHNRVLSFEPERMLSIQVAKAPASFPFRAKASQMWTVMYFTPTPDGKTSLRIVGLGFGSDKESQDMKEFFERGNAYTLEELQKHFQK